MECTVADEVSFGRIVQCNVPNHGNVRIKSREVDERRDEQYKQYKQYKQYVRVDASDGGR